MRVASFKIIPPPESRWYFQENRIFLKDGDHYCSEKSKIFPIQKNKVKMKYLSSNLFIFEISLQVFGYISTIIRSDENMSSTDHRGKAD